MTPMSKTTKFDDKCSFCGSTADNIKGKLIEGTSGKICRMCVEKCGLIFKAQDNKEQEQPRQPINIRVPPPKEIKAFLDKYVVGQERTKQTLSVAVHNHYQRIQQDKLLPKDHPLHDIELDKSNVLMMGPSGSGKTLLAKTLAKMLGVPFSISDVTTLTEAGYVGSDVEEVLLRLHQAANGDMGMTEIGIIYLDEFDKCARKTENVSITRDVSGEGVQQALLKILEGTISSVPMQGGRKHPQAECLRIDTSKILFICGGAFVGIEEIIKRRMKGKSRLGFGADIGSKAELDKVQPQDLIKFGMIPEIVGRLPVVTTLELLSEDDLVHVLTQPKNAIFRQYEKMLAFNEATLVVEEAAFREMARIAVIKGTGARALRSLFEDIMLPVMFDLKPKSHIVITKDMVVRAAGGTDKAA
jgi:ATP-dependent Clp protease ATP-binding subunit ClpX